jgi:hypothetical protein
VSTSAAHTRISSRERSPSSGYSPSGGAQGLEQHVPFTTELHTGTPTAVLEKNTS